MIFKNVKEEDLDSFPYEIAVKKESDGSWTVLSHKDIPIKPVEKLTEELEE